MTKASQLRKLLKTKKKLVLGGAHDALSSKLIEEEDYQKSWETAKV